MGQSAGDNSSFSDICTSLCNGLCCNPWWGIISYNIKKDGALRDLKGFAAEVRKGIAARAGRIKDAYVTSEKPPRALFGEPERYSVVARNISVSGDTINIEVLAMFAFRCRFFSDRTCAIHPSVIGNEIRPPHCAALGEKDAQPGQKGYCRIIHAASSGEAGIKKAIETELGVSAGHFAKGVVSAQEAADMLVAQVREFCSTRAPGFVPVRSASAPGRNDPCHCGSGKKFKKCHGA